VLGWSNAAKITALENKAKVLENHLAELAGKLAEFDKAEKAVKARLDTLSKLDEYRDFRELDWRPLAGWIIDHPRPGIYPRQISLAGVDTKFIERHKKLMSEWLDMLLPETAIDRQHSGIGGFEQRYGFLARPQLIRFRLLDSRLAIARLTDLTVTAEEFASLNLPVSRVFVTENDINGLAFPEVEGGMVIFGRGYGFEALASAEWLHGKNIHYWGDIDSHGFAPQPISSALSANPIAVDGRGNLAEPPRTLGEGV